MKDILALTCGIFQAEMQRLAPRFPRLRFVLADSMLHMRPDLLQSRIDDELAKHPPGKTLFIYGDCTPRIVELSRKPGFAKTTGINCCEILLGREEYRRLRKAGAFFFLPEWTLRWRDVFERELEYLSIDLPPDLKSAIAVINGLIEERLALLASLHFTVPKREKLSIKALNAINAQIQQRIASRDPAGYSAASVYAECMKLKHAVTLAESQGSEVLKGYLAKLIAEGTGSGGSKASQRLAADQSFRELFARSTEWTKELHPKTGFVLDLVKAQLEAFPKSRIIVFAT
ncbi:MAG: hypothetical protein CVU63_24970, partial [Deltaproteobacteria bacterium HGW-Deltaproteobacteria-20]